jgi:quinol monooxygenase YgiN
MVLIEARFTVDAESLKALLGAVADLVHASLAEPGCLRFECYEDVWSPGAFVVLGAWADRAALDLHEGSAQVAAFKTLAAPLMVAREPTRIYDVARAGVLGG